MLAPGEELIRDGGAGDDSAAADDDGAAATDDRPPSMPQETAASDHVLEAFTEALEPSSSPRSGPGGFWRSELSE